jgi:hypothetical protein
MISSGLDDMAAGPMWLAQRGPHQNPDPRRAIVRRCELLSLYGPSSIMGNTGTNGWVCTSARPDALPLSTRPPLPPHLEDYDL